MEPKLDPNHDANAIFSKKYENMGFTTRAVHSGQQPERLHGGVTTAIDMSTTFAQTFPGVPFGKYDYGRAGNPTKTSLEIQIAALHEGKYAQIFSSGMAATSAIIHLLNIGDEVLCIDDVYGGTQRYFKQVSMVNQGVNFVFAGIEKPENLRKALSKKTKMIWIESPSNPTLKVTDIKEAVKMIRGYNKDIIIVSDNTFMSPFNVNPLSLGVDIVMESGTKYLGGHSDVIMGVVVTNCPVKAERIYYMHKCIGSIPSPFDCFLMIRSLISSWGRVWCPSFLPTKSSSAVSDAYFRKNGDAR